MVLGDEVRASRFLMHERKSKRKECVAMKAFTTEHLRRGFGDDHSGRCKEGLTRKVSRGGLKRKVS